MKKYFVYSLLVASLFLSGCSLWGGSEDGSQDGDQGDSQVIEENGGEEGSDNGDEQIISDDLSDVYKVEDEEAVLAKAKDLYNLANELALDWQSDARLLLVSTRYFSSLDEEGVVDKFVFSSDLQPRYYWSIDISRDDISQYTRTLIFREDYILKEGVLNIPIKYWKVTYAAALEKADILGGYQYRRDYPSYQISQMLSLADNNNLAWYVVYTSPETEDNLRIVIDAATGEQIE